jgi:hypothetical protein
MPEEVAADNASRQLFFDEKAGVVDVRKNR